jgi:hypothetical protein
LSTFQIPCADGLIQLRRSFVEHLGPPQHH